MVCQIYIPMGGRCGNQLFYYGFGRWLVEQYKKNGVEANLIFDLTNVLKMGSGKYCYETSGWVNCLSEFNVIRYDVYEKKRCTYREGNLYQKCIAFVLTLFRRITDEKTDEVIKRAGGFLDKMGLIYAYADRDINENIFVRGGKVFVRKVPECSKYINEIRAILLGELKICQQDAEHNKELYEIIRNNNSVCVSIRRGDYVTNPDVAAKFTCCDRQYFAQAIKIMRDKIENPTFVFFSDDIEWCRKTFGSSEKYFFESGKDSLAEKLYLMSSCRHFIISNSTFSWWAQWMGEDGNKMVISPERWYKNRQDTLVENEFIKVPVS